MNSGSQKCSWLEGGVENGSLKQQVINNDVNHDAHYLGTSVSLLVCTMLNKLAEVAVILTCVHRGVSF
jgi:hypothetical protein